MDEFSVLKIGIIDYSVGNLKSVAKVIEKLGVKPELIRGEFNPERFDGLILPGVGSCGSAMSFLETTGLSKLLDEYVNVIKKPILGICLGFQIMCEYSEEDNRECLGWIKGSVRHFRSCISTNMKVPHMGWNDVKYDSDFRLLKGLRESPCFYFAHSYILPFDINVNGMVGITEYHIPFVSIYENENIFGVQFHPEKSYVGGEIVFRNFLQEVKNAKS